MNSTGKRFITVAFLGELLISTASVIMSQTTQTVNRSDWTGGVNVPSYISMQIYVPKTLADKPPIIVSSHACQTPVSNQINVNKKILAKADLNGFIMIFPDFSGRNCWDVGSTNALKHDGGGDPHAIAQMVRYTLKKYHGDSTRVYALGGSSGGMMTQALAAIYPEIFTAVTPRAGVPCGCWAVNFNASRQWSDQCSGGTVSKTAKEWGDIVRAINPNYTGHRPRVQLMQGDADATISYKNMAEGIKQWTNVLDLKTEPDSTAKITSNETGTNYTYNCKFWKNKCGYVVLESWFAVGGSHSMNYEETAILKFFGLDVAGGSDPELAKCSVGIFRNNPVRTFSSAALRSWPTDLTIFSLNGKMVKVLNSADKTNRLQGIPTGMVCIVSDKVTGQARLMLKPR